jgi:N-carbamoylputrescine amidase
MSDNAHNKVALVSLLVTSDIERNFSAMTDAVERAYAEECQLVCFPECALTGLIDAEDYESDIKLAVEIPGNTTDEIGLLARTHNLHIAIGILERDHERIYDTAVLFDNKGEIILKYRRINPRWHSPNAPKNLYMEGTTFDTASTSLGEIAFAICGDMFDDTVVAKIQRARADYLVVPLARSFADYTQTWWEKEEKWAYVQQITKIGITSFLVNSFESQAKWPSFGGSMVVSSDGRIIAETEIGEPSFLACEFSRSI